MAKEIKILVVDDADINRQILRTLLDREYEIFEAGDGVEALKVLEEVPIDIIILDLVMPNMNGIEFLQIIKSDDRFRHISVIVSSAAGSAENELQVLSLGADNFISKPYNPKLILHRVNSIVKTYIESRKEYARETEEMNDRLFSFMEYIPGGFCVVQKTDKYLIQFANTKLARMLGYTPTECKNMCGHEISDYISDYDTAKTDEVFNVAVELGNVESELMMIKKDGTVRRMKADIKADNQVPGSNQFMITLSPSDIAEKEAKLKKKIKDYEMRVKQDPLTELFNKDAFFTATAKMIADNPNEHFVIGQWNFDRFKVINELYGSSAGDRVIHDFGVYIKEFFTGLATYGRLEADNFATCCTKEFLDSHADEIDSLLLGKINWNHVNYPLQIHVGFYNVEHMNEDVMLMCDRAGMALSPIKESYIKRIAYFSDEMKETYVKEQQMMRDAETAIVNREFYVVYQPIINVKTKKIVSAEALVRWKKANGEIVSPGDFIPVFEKNGFVARLDMYVAEEVLKFQNFRKVHNKSIVPVSVNLSRVDFYNNNLSNDILRMIDDYGLDTSCLKLEITESAYMDRPQELMDTIEEFQNAGFKVLMDDFGSGFSSLNMLKDVNADILKIDMQFMDNLETSDKAGSILYSIIQMAKSIRMEVVAEGVETANQYELLFSMDCDSIQGYYFYRPLPEEEFSQRLDEDEMAEPVIDSKVHNSILCYFKSEDDFVELNRKVSSICRVRPVYELDTFLKILSKDCLNLDMAFLDMSNNMEQALDVINQIKSKSYLADFPLIFFADSHEMDYVAEVFDRGAFDILIKPIDWNLMYHRLRKQFREQNRSSLREEYDTTGRNKNLRRRLEYSAAISNVALAKVFIRDEEDFPIKSLVYLNDRFLYLHQMMEEEARTKRTLKDLLNRVLPRGLSDFLVNVKEAIDSGQTVLQHEFYVRWENSLTKKMLITCTLQYHGDEIYMDLVEMENFSSAEFKIDRLIQGISRQISIGSDVRVWRYYADRDMLVNYKGGADGNYSTSSIEKGSEYVINYPYFDKADKERVTGMIERMMSGADNIVEDFVMDRTDGSGKKRFVRISCMRMDAVDENGDFIIGVSRDITNDKIIENQKWNEKQYWKRMSRGAAFFLEADINDNRILSENTKDMMSDMGFDRNYSLFGFIDKLKGTVKEDEQQRIGEILSKENLVNTYEAGQNTIRFDFLADLYGTGTFIWYNSDIFLLMNESNSHLYITWQVTNIKQNIQTESVVKRMAGQDELTGLCNRIMIEMGMDAMLAEDKGSKNGVFMVMDLDDFKQVNDRFGHDFGDDVIRAIGNVFKQGFGESDIVARLSGDEFAVFMPGDVEKSKVEEIASDICKRARLNLDDGEKSITIGCSIGILYTDRVADFKEAYSLAMVALATAKKNGKDCYVFCNG